MPNWCTNNVTFKNSDPDLVTQLVNGFNDNKLFETFMPFADGEWDYGTAIEMWGTKWDVGKDSYSSSLVEHEPGYATLTFDTAWSPPISFYNFMFDNGWEIYATYEGEGLQFVGIYEGGSDDYWDVQSDVDWIKDHIPAYIIDEFDLIERIEEEKAWEAELEEADVVEESQDTSES